MPSTAVNLRQPRTRRDLVLLLVAAFGSVLAMTLALVAKGDGLTDIMPARLMIAVGIVAAALLAAAVVWRVSTILRMDARNAREESAVLKRRLATAEAIVKAEPQVLVYWERGEQAKVVAHSLPHVPGIPATPGELLSYGHWLEPHCAHAFKAALNELFDKGQAFNIILKTKANGYLEADGRAAGGRAVLRLRDVAGYRRDLGRILDAASAARPRHPRQPRAAQCAAESGVDRGRRWPAVLGQRGLREGRGGQQRRRGHRTPDRIAGDAPARGAANARSPRIAPIGRSFRSSSRSPRPSEVIAFRSATRPPRWPSTSPRWKRARRTRRSIRRLRPHARSRGHRRRHVQSPISASRSSTRPTQLWQLDPEWLATAPTDGAVLDRLRSSAVCPEVAKYREWKAKQLEPIRPAPRAHEDWWHLLDGRIIHVMSVQRPDGGITYLYDDETERFALKSRYNALIEVQSETLDSLKEGVAVFATDGRLKLSNSAFAADLEAAAAHARAKSPHIDEHHPCVADALYDRQATWARISRAVTGVLRRAQAGRGPDDAARSERHRLRRHAAARRRNADHLRRRHRRPSATSGRWSSATRRWSPPTG